MRQRYGGRTAVTPNQALSFRSRAFVAAALMTALLWTSASARAADTDAPYAPPPPTAGMEPRGSNGPGGPAAREDEPALGEERSPGSGEVGPPPFQGGCPYRGRTLELIV